MSSSVLARARALSWREWVAFAEAWLVLAWLQPASRALPYSFLQRLASSRQRLGQTRPGRREEADRVGLAVARAEHHHLLTIRCLARSLTLQLLLDRRGIASDLRFGVRREGVDLLAHAWIEHDGQPLAEPPHALGEFLPLEQTS